jgi:hypothetical protein
MNRMGRRASLILKGGPSAKITDSGSDKSSKKKKKQNVMQINGALWALDEHGNPLKRLRKKTKGPTNDDQGKPNNAKKKKNIVEIDGQPWLMDESGNPVKKLRKKVTDGDNSSDEKESKRKAPTRSKSTPLRSKSRDKRPGNDSDGGSRGGNRRNGRVRGREEITRRGRSKSRSRTAKNSDSESSSTERRRAKQHGNEESLEQLMESSSQKRKKKKTKVVEIDGRLWACDENGNPVKKVKKKGGDSDGEQRGRSQSQGPARIRRNESFTDEKGRRHVFDENSIETVFDRSGKKLRKKGQPKPEVAKPIEEKESVQKKAPLNRSSREVEFGIFDHLWDDTSIGGSNRFSIGDSERAIRTSDMYPVMPTRGSEHGSDPTRISGQIGEADPHDRNLQLELEKAKQEMRSMAEQARKEKSKNIKAMTDMMQLKAEYHDANSELLQLRSKVNDLSSEIVEKEVELVSAKEEAVKNPSTEANEGIAELEAEKDNLASKLQLEKATAQNEIRKKEEQLLYMNKELGVLRYELEMLITGKKGNLQVDPIMVRLLREKKEFELKYNQEKEVNSIKISSLQEMIDSLESMNQDLNKQMLMSENGNQNTGLLSTASTHIPPRKRTPDFERKPPAPSKSFDGGVFSVSPAALNARTWFGRRGSILGGGGGI